MVLPSVAPSAWWASCKLPALAPPYAVAAATLPWLVAAGTGAIWWVRRKLLDGAYEGASSRRLRAPIGFRRLRASFLTSTRLAYHAAYLSLVVLWAVAAYAFALHWLSLRFFCFFNLPMGNLLFAVVHCIAEDPGTVPSNWAYQMGDDMKRSRYCKICNVWKPDRCHHCSVCNRCVLNMDHHCPWLGNCIGFFNKRYFLQSLGYLLVANTMLVTAGSTEVYRLLAKKLYETRFELWINTTFLAYSYIIQWKLVNFIRFHAGLLKDNFSTIENLSRMVGRPSDYDIGPQRNFEQVFGKNIWGWFLPVHHMSFRPVGDGVTWAKRDGI